MSNTPELNWHTSSYCGDAINCVNVAAAPDGTVRLRESAQPDAVLAVSRDQFQALIRGIKAGEFTAR
ncbi:hypothetical protein AQ490_02615 [Wenjunlia vitaminophila]|uniref:DUF397 domain-containing protein n=1 Tax=Wenjunlia vitaminophila TaxID=76728 RepID=A0A0T6LYQ4_WENVI|nr:DUF397 domain-containing protein [Wenjunlia vitaminophila]KRV51113.1 hypothetical protein AQ490_02615 [Wenjunlia vitaminophila]